MVASKIQCYSAKKADAFGLFFVYTVACMIQIPVMQFINFFYSIVHVIDNVNILKINDKLKIQLTAHFQKILHKLPLCTFTILILTTYT